MDVCVYYNVVEVYFTTSYNDNVMKNTFIIPFYIPKNVIILRSFRRFCSGCCSYKNDIHRLSNISKTNQTIKTLYFIKLTRYYKH